MSLRILRRILLEWRHVSNNRDTKRVFMQVSMDLKNLFISLKNESHRENLWESTNWHFIQYRLSTIYHAIFFPSTLAIGYIAREMMCKKIRKRKSSLRKKIFWVSWAHFPEKPRNFQKFVDQTCCHGLKLAFSN